MRSPFLIFLSTMAKLPVVLFAFVTALIAGDVTGKWNAKVPMRDGEHAITMILKADGAKLTGSVGSDNGETEVLNGKIEGDSLSFNLETSSARYVVKGKLAGNEIRFSAQREGGERAIEFTATKAE
jgi:hypothetical protein